MRPILSVPVVLVALSTFGVLAAAGEPAPASAPPSPQRKILDRYVGKWDVRALVEVPSQQASHGFETIMTAEWSVGGYFVDQSSTIQGKVVGKALYSYDEVTQEYRSWCFEVPGIGIATRGHWDEEKQTFTWRGTGPNDTPFIATDRFQPDGSIKGTIVIGVKDSDVHMIGTYTATRRKPEKQQ